MKVAICLLFAVCLDVAAGDILCTRIKGLCRFTYEGCEGHFIKGQCSGPVNRQCCLPYDDSECKSTGGRCQHTSTTCAGGTYVQGKCGGPYNRLCCVQNPGDRLCRLNKGRCRYTDEGCNGHFIRGQCSGPWNRQCCRPSGVGSKVKYNADIMKLSPTGCKASTCRQDGISYTGVRASNHLLDTDYGKIKNKKSCYVSVGNKYKIHPAVIAAIASRESRAGRVLYRHPHAGTYGWGDCSRTDCSAYGIMQCNIVKSGLKKRCTRFSYDSCQHIKMVTKYVLVNKMLKCIKKKFRSWSPEQQLQGAVAAYNIGCDNMWYTFFSKLDDQTTGKDFSNDVMARAQHLIIEYGW